MTLPASLPIDLQQIYAEFGAPLGTALTALVRGGAYVPNIAQNLGVPTAPPISISQFVGAGANAVTLPNTTVQGLTFSPTDSTAGFNLTSGGQRQSVTTTGGTTNLGAWLLAGTASDYECVATLISGTVTTGTIGTPLNLGTTRSWTKVNTSNLASTQTVVFTLVIRTVIGAVVKASATITLEAIVDV